MMPPPRKSPLFPYTTLFRSLEPSALLGMLNPGERLHAVHRMAMLERSEEHTSELQSQFHLVCRLLLEKKKTISNSDVLCAEARAAQSGRCAQAPHHRDAITL